MNYLDIILLIPLVFGFISGLKKGLVFEVASLVALIVGAWGAVKFSYIIADLLFVTFDWTSPYMGLISLAITFTLIVITVNLIAKLLDTLIDAVALGFINTLAGGVFGLLKSGIFIGVIILILNAFVKNANIIPEEIRVNSVVYQTITTITDAILPLIDFESIGEKATNAIT